MVIQVNSKIKDYIEIIQKVAKVEQRRIPSHMVEYEELVSIGIIAIQAMMPAFPKSFFAMISMENAATISIAR